MSSTQASGMSSSVRALVMIGVINAIILAIALFLSQAATDGSSELTVTDSSHGAVQNDFVSIEGAVTLGGNITASVLNQEYQITTIVDGNSYKITAKDTSGSTVTANSSDSGNGGSGVDGYYQINTGLDLFVQSTGWGVGAWGSGGWGSSTPLSATNQLRLFTH